MCNEDRFRLMQTIANGNEDLAVRIFAESSDKAILDPVGPLRVTAFQLAAWQGKINLLNRFYEAGVDVNAEDKIGRSALYYAVHRGYTEVVKWLIEHGATAQSKAGVSYCSGTIARSQSAEAGFVGRNLPLPECWGRTVLHQAVKNNHPEVVRILVNAGADVNAADEHGVTPLLVAGSAVNREKPAEVSKFNEIIGILASANVATNVVHPDTGATALHQAAALGSSVAAKILLDAGAWSLHRCAGTGCTPLHIAAGAGHLGTLLVLLKAMSRDQVDARDLVNRTPLHRASCQGHQDCVRALIDHGGNLAAETKTGVTVADAIFAHIPRPLAFLMDVLDSRVQGRCCSSEKDARITVDFDVLAPKGELQMGVVTALVAAASDVEQLTILQHPLVETFLRLKWSRLRIFFFLLVLVHFSFILSLSSYAIILMRYETNSELPRAILTFCSCILLLNNTAALLMDPRHYVKEYETWLCFTYTTLSLAISVAGDYVENARARPGEKELDGFEHRSRWVLHSISVAILLGWMQMMLLVGRFPTWGYYALMFSTVLKNILKVLLAFVCLIVGFALSFAVLFRGNDQFRDFWRAVVKTVVMMMGEYEYGDLFSDEGNEGTSLPATSRVVFVVFVMLASIALMNLMIGLAVNDIQGLEKEGHIRRLLKQAEFVAHLEKVTSRRILRCEWLNSRSKVFLDSRRVIPTKISFGCYERYFHNSSRCVPAKLVEALFLLASKRARSRENLLMSEKHANVGADLTSLLCNLEQQLRLFRLSNRSRSARRISKSMAKRNLLRSKTASV